MTPLDIPQAEFYITVIIGGAATLLAILGAALIDLKVPDDREPVDYAYRPHAKVWRRDHAMNHFDSHERELRNIWS